MIKICLATNNAHKIEEISAALPPNLFSCCSLAAIGCTEELPETQSLIAANALQKALYVAQKYNVSALADDSGLEVEALGGLPGVDSAYFAGPQKSYHDNNAKLIRLLKDQPNRKARFVTCMAFAHQGQCHLFFGYVHGQIIDQALGDNGFGYDPHFLPDGQTRTFAQMSTSEKNMISHRSRALEAFLTFVKRHISVV